MVFASYFDYSRLRRLNARNAPRKGSWCHFPVNVRRYYDDAVWRCCFLCHQRGLTVLPAQPSARKNWYYFADCGVESITLAANIYREEPDTVIIFGEKTDDHTEFPDFPCLFINASPAKIIAHKKNMGSICKIFLMKENDIGTNSRAIDLHELPVEVYARTTNGQDHLSGNINFFHSYDCCARQYWHSKPLCNAENTIVIIGFGNYGRCILKRAILTNILSVDQHVSYHIFGDAESFLATHNHLHETFSLNKTSDTTDSLIFHKELWELNHMVMAQADRIIICPDNEPEGWNIYWRLNSYYQIRGNIHLHSNRKTPGITYFGTNEEIYTPNQIMRTSLNRAAVIINEIFCKSVSYPTKTWEELDAFHRESKIAAADHILMKIRVLMQDEDITELTLKLRRRHIKNTVKTNNRQPFLIPIASWTTPAGGVFILITTGLMVPPEMILTGNILCYVHMNN